MLHTFHGSLAIVSADNPASNAMGGFTESTSAYRHCRQCMGTKEEMKTQVNLLNMCEYTLTL